MRKTAGTVYLVGAGPGDPGLITGRGLELLRVADVVVHDRLVAAELLEEVRPEAEVIDVGKAPGKHRFCQSWINALLVERAKKGRAVVRLKGGDPFVFGRGYEELTACRRAAVDCVVIPGVSSALAAPAAAGIPITNRGSVRSLAIISARVADPTGAGHRPDLLAGSGDSKGVANSAPALNYKALAGVDAVIILMGRANLREVTRSLMEAGRKGSTPAACIERAYAPDQRVTKATLATLADAVDRDGLCAPVVTVVGEVAAHAVAGEYRDLGLSVRAGSIQ